MSATPGGSRLAFTDLSLTRLSGGDDVLRAKLSDIGGAFDQHCQSIENRASDAKDQVLKQLNGAGGGRQVLKRQLQGLKSSLLNLGQKEFFSEAILNFSETHDYKAESDRSAAALESSEEDLKDLKKANLQDEDHLREAIRMIEGYQLQNQQIAARLALKLEAAVAEFEVLEASSKPPPLSPLPFAGDEEELERLLSEQGQLAITMEAELARTEASCRDLEGDVQSNRAEMQHMEAEIARLQALKEDEARLTEGRHSSCIEWCDAMMAILVKATGVSIISIQEDAIRLAIRAQDQTAGSDMCVKEYTLSAFLEPGSSALSSAELSPQPSPAIDLRALVAFAKHSRGGLPLLLTLVQGELGI